MSQLHPVLDKFYLSSLLYAGLSYENNIIKNTNDQLGPITIDNKFLTLPYFNNLKNPDGKMIYHPLNENYTNPENTVFNFYKKRLILELNLKLSYMVINIITIAADVQLQQKIKSSKLINIISNIGEVDHILIENFTHLIKASKKTNAEAFLFDIFLKKNGEINDTPYAAIGKLNFILPNEICKSLEEKEKDYRVYGYRLRKKDVLSLINIFNLMFPDFTDKNKYVEGTDNKIFRYLNILMKTSYMVSARINELCDLLEELKEPTLNLTDCVSDLDWVNQLEDLYGLASEIRIIPNQLDLSVESQQRLNINESKANITEPVTQVARQEFTPSNVPVVTQPVQTQQVVQQPQVMTAEDIIKGNLSVPQMVPIMNPNMMIHNPMMMQQQTFTPSWVQQETMRTQQQQPMMHPNMYPNMSQPMMYPNMQQQPPMMYPNVYPNMPQPMMQQQQHPMMYSNMQPQPNTMIMQPNGIELNPMFMGGR